MVAPVLLQSVSGSTAGTIPPSHGVPAPSIVVNWPAPTTAGSLLVASLINPGGSPTPFTDDAGNTFILDQACSGGTFSACLCYAFNAVGGATQATLPSTGSGVWSLHEFKNVLATSDPAVNCSAFDIEVPNPTISLAYSLPSGALVLFIGMSTANGAISLPTGLTLAETQQTQYGSLKTGWLVGPNHATTGTLSVNLTVPGPTALFAGSFQHA